MISGAVWLRTPYPTTISPKTLMTLPTLVTLVTLVTLMTLVTLPTLVTLMTLPHGQGKVQKKAGDSG